MENYCKTLVAVFVVSMAYGCSPTYYMPNTQHVPVIKSQGETNLVVGGNANQVEVQAAYGISDRLAVQLNTGFFIPKDSENGNGGSGSLIEGGLGYYRNVSPNFLFDIYGLVGFGRMENHFPAPVQVAPPTSGEISASVVRYGIQPGMTYHNRHFSVTASGRVGNISYSNIQGNLIFEGNNQVDYLNNHRSSYVLEPALTLRGGLEKLKLQVQLLKSINLSHQDFRQEDALMTLGLTYQF